MQKCKCESMMRVIMAKLNYFEVYMSELNDTLAQVAEAEAALETQISAVVAEVNLLVSEVNTLIEQLPNAADTAQAQAQAQELLVRITDATATLQAVPPAPELPA